MQILPAPKIPSLFILAAAVELVFLSLAAGNTAFHLNDHAVWFVIYGLIAGVGYLAAVARFFTVSSRFRAVVFWSLAIAFRIAMLPAVPGDDLWRYLWEGSLTAEGWNPYVFAPESSQFREWHAEWLGLVNHPDWPAIYPPGIETIFGLLVRVSATPLFFKLVFVAADLLTLTLLLRLNTGQQRYRNTSWYAWNPLVVYSFAGAGHFDSLMLLTLVASVLALHRANPMNDQKPNWIWAMISALLLGASIAVKIIPVLLVPAWIIALRWRSVVLLLTPAVVLLFAFGFGYPEIPIFDNLSRFAAVTRTNDLFWWLIEPHFWKNEDGRNYEYIGITLAVTVLLAVWFRNDWRSALLWIFGAILILSPALHAWYVVWILPIASWRRARVWFVLSVSVFFYFLLWEVNAPLTPWIVPLWLRLCIILPPLLAWPVLRWFEGRDAASGIATRT